LELPRYFPFKRLKLPSDEAVLWYGYNPTFHRLLDYGLLLTCRALYVYRRTWWRLFGHWRRLPLSEIVAVRRIDQTVRPGLRIEMHRRSIDFYTPHDFYWDEMAFDRGVLEKAITAIKAAEPKIRTDFSGT
jgi:hypothetical protein